MYVIAASGTNSFVQFITLIVVFVIVLFITYYTTKFIGNYQKVSNKNSNFKIIESYRLSNTKYLQIIQIGNKYLAISVCKDSITTLTELSEEEVKIPEYTSTQESFAQIFDKIKGNIKQIDKNKEHDDGKDK